MSRPRGMSREEIEEIYVPAYRPGRVPIQVNDETSSDEDDDDSDDGLGNGTPGGRFKDEFSMKEVEPRFRVQRVLGKGSYGLVVRASVDEASAVEERQKQEAGASLEASSSFLPSSPPASTVIPESVVAIKRVRRALHSSTTARRLLREVRLLRTLGGHRNVTSLLTLLVPGPAGGSGGGGNGSNSNSNSSSSSGGGSGDGRSGGGGSVVGSCYGASRFETVYMVLEAADCDLFKVLNSTVTLSPLQVKTMMRQLLQALEWLHSHRVVHRDIKPANILLNRDCCVKLADFGLSRWLPPPEESKSSMVEEAPLAKRGRRRVDTGDIGDVPNLLQERSDDLSSSSPSPSPSPSPAPFSLTVGLPMHQSLRSLSQSSSTSSHAELSPSPPSSTSTSSEHLSSIGTNEEDEEEDAKSLQQGRSESKDDDKPAIPRATLSMMRRQVSAHVVTETYRAPELLALDGVLSSRGDQRGRASFDPHRINRIGAVEYDIGVDLWSAGCVFAELLRATTPPAAASSTTAVASDAAAARLRSAPSPFDAAPTGPLPLTSSSPAAVEGHDYDEAASEPSAKKQRTSATAAEVEVVVESSSASESSESSELESSGEQAGEEEAVAPLALDDEGRIKGGYQQRVPLFFSCGPPPLWLRPAETAAAEAIAVAAEEAAAAAAAAAAVTGSGGFGGRPRGASALSPPPSFWSAMGQSASPSSLSPRGRDFGLRFGQQQRQREQCLSREALLSLATIMDKIGVPPEALGTDSDAGSGEGGEDEVPWGEGLAPATLALIRAAAPLIEREDTVAAAATAAAAAAAAAAADCSTISTRATTRARALPAAVSSRLAGQVPAATSAAALALLSELLQYAPKRRPSATAALSHGYFSPVPPSVAAAAAAAAAGLEAGDDADALRDRVQRTERCSGMEQLFLSASGVPTSPSSMIRQIRRELWAEVDGPL